MSEMEKSEIEPAYEAVKAHAEEMLRGFRSGVAVYEDHLIELVRRVDALGHAMLVDHLRDGPWPPAAPPAPGTADPA
jgi:hypothetical protein